ncbi:hypothetical protein KCH_74610 [Kitasatospora cheerisanensis KCTC 2395]|uniref:Uncharacterized protein n=1 Tax=Kitasatospora cheerisanensis KCTC 2395 TaxID=1348663 RepID=A0A066YRW1_9ACTN|nr:hypothetical protein KCH_74610 [Kitasatospora cheerisanensis KCTC 2395]
MGRAARGGGVGVRPGADPRPDGASPAPRLGAAGRGGRAGRDSARGRRPRAPRGDRPRRAAAAAPAAAAVRSYLRGLPPTLGLSYAALVDPAAPLAPEDHQPAAWLPLDRPWDSCFPADRPRMRAHADRLAGGR